MRRLLAPALVSLNLTFVEFFDGQIEYRCLLPFWTGLLSFASLLWLLEVILDGHVRFLGASVIRGHVSVSCPDFWDARVVLMVLLEDAGFELHHAIVLGCSCNGLTAPAERRSFVLAFSAGAFWRRVTDSLLRGLVAVIGSTAFTLVRASVEITLRILVDSGVIQLFFVIRFVSRFVFWRETLLCRSGELWQVRPDIILNQHRWRDRRQLLLTFDDFLLPLILRGGRNDCLRHFVHATGLFYLIPELKVCYGPIDGNFFRGESLLPLGLLPDLLRAHSLDLLASVCVYVAPFLVELLPNLDLELAQLDIVDIVHQLVKRVILRLELQEARLEARRMIR